MEGLQNGLQSELPSAYTVTTEDRPSQTEVQSEEHCARISAMVAYVEKNGLPALEERQKVMAENKLAGILVIRRMRNGCKVEALRGKSGEVMLFSSMKEARAKIKRLTEEPYFTEWGEIASPRYLAVALYP